MKQSLILLALVVICLALWLQWRVWWPWLQGLLIDPETGTIVQGLGALATVGTVVAAVIGVIWRVGRKDPADRARRILASPAHAETVYVGERDFTPSPAASVTLEGNSGAGKSSLVNAGLLPRLDGSALDARTGVWDWRR